MRRWVLPTVLVLQFVALGYLSWRYTVIRHDAAELLESTQALLGELELNNCLDHPLPMPQKQASVTVPMAVPRLDRHTGVGRAHVRQGIDSRHAGQSTTSGAG